MEAVEGTFVVEVGAEAVEASCDQMPVSSEYGAQTTSFPK